MGKKKNVDMSVDHTESQETKDRKYQEKLAKRKAEKNVEANVSETKSASGRTVWEDLYTDLNSRVAGALREARVKPEQLVAMSDGEITAIDGIGEVGLEEIRAKYMADINAEPSSAESSQSSELPNSSELQESEPTKLPANKRHNFRGGKAIKAAKSKVDRTKTYSVEEAVKLVKSSNITKFDATLTIHLNLKEKMSRVEVTFPHMAGSAKKIAIASDELIEEIANGKIDFDILLTTPAMMPKLAKYARVLGPKGLMPSPKSGTVTPDPEAKKKEFEGGKTVVKGEAKYPLMHVTVGKLSQKDEELIENIETLVEAVKLKNIEKATLASTMSPGVKLQLN